MPEFPDYKILNEAGRGSSNVIYRAEDVHLHRVVALKVTLPSPMEEHRFRSARFLREAQAVAIMDGHPNVPALYCVGEHQGQLYYTMELVDGATFKELVASGAFNATKGVRVIADIAKAIGSVHENGLIHRNVNQSKILIAADGTPKLLGFGKVGPKAEPNSIRVGISNTSPRFDVVALQAMLEWLFTALRGPIPDDLQPALGSVASAVQFAEIVERFLR
jgi:serine/threonine protein kinase